MSPRFHRRSQAIRCGLGAAAVLLAASGAPALERHAGPAAEALDLMTIDAGDAVIPGLGSAYWVIPGPQVDIPLVLAEPAPPGAFITTLSSFNPYNQKLSFKGGETSASMSETVAGTPVEFYPGWVGTWGYFTFQTGVQIGFGDPSTLYMVQTSATAAHPRGSDCYLQFWCQLTHLLLGDADSLQCLGAGRGTPGLDALRRYRDEVLASTAHGQFYVDLYNQWSTEAILALVASPSLAVRMWNAHAEWLAGFQALVDGQGDSFPVTGTMQTSLLDILDRMEAAGSPSFASMLAFERSRLQVNAIVGLSMTQLQSQVETLGGVSPVEPQSWGRTKSLYR